MTRRGARRALRPLLLQCHADRLFDPLHRLKLLAGPALLIASRIIGVEHREQLVLMNDGYQEEALRVREEGAPASSPGMDRYRSLIDEKGGSNVGDLRTDSFGMRTFN